MSFPRRAIRSYTVGTTLYATGSAVPPAAFHFMHHDTRSRTVTAPALLLTLVLLFAFQGEAILKQPLVIALLAVPIYLVAVALDPAAAGAPAALLSYAAAAASLLLLASSPL